MSDAGSVKIIKEPSLRKNVKYTPFFKTRRISDDSRLTGVDTKPTSWTIRVRQFLGLLTLLLLFTISVMGSVVMWATTFYDDTINEKLILKNGSSAFETWRKSPVKPIMRFRLFNYTNLQAFKDGVDARLQVEEIGPYTFMEQSERVNIVFNDNGTITYQDQKTYEFVPELSAGSLNDTVVTMNMPLMALNYKTRKSNFAQRFLYSAPLLAIVPQPFHAKTVQEVFWGYEDALIKMASLAVKDLKVGLLQQKNGTAPNTVTVYSGADDLSQLGQISRFDGMELVDYYTTDECNRVDGSDGTKFPPPLVVPGSKLYIYHRDVCRRVPLQFEKEVDVWNGVPALRFRPPTNVLDDGESNPENGCYCIEDLYDVCEPSGVMNTARCKNDAPIFASFPHFYLGDQVLLDAVDGLRPDRKKHDMYLDIHQTGVPVAGRSRFQFNVLVKNPFNNFLLSELDGKILPFVWLERELGDFPPEIKKLLYTVSFTVPQIKMALKYGTLIAALITGVALLIWTAVALYSLLKPQVKLPEVYIMTRL